MTTSAALRIGEIPVGEARVVAVGSAEVAVFRTRSGRVHALGARCPHRGGPLADGLCDESVVVCPLHGRSFDLATGHEVDGDLAVATWHTEVAGDGSITVRPAAESRLPAT